MKRLRRQWQITRDPALKARVSCLQKSVTYRLNDWMNEKWSDMLAVRTSRYGRWQTGWCEFRLLRTPCNCRENCLWLRESESPGRQPWSLFQPVDDPSVPAAIEIVRDARMRVVKWTDGNRSLGGPTGHQETQRWEGSGPERYIE
jgi:hypothetical protein